MAEKKKVTDEPETKKELTPKEEKAYWAELVPFRAFKDNGKYADDIIVGVNGKFWQIKRGEDVMIPRNVREVIYQSMEQDAATANLIERESSRFEEESRRYN